MTFFKSGQKLRRRPRRTQAQQRPAPATRLELVRGSETGPGVRPGRPAIKLVYSRDSVKRLG